MCAESPNISVLGLSGLPRGCGRKVRKASVKGTETLIHP